jgi:ribosomal protein S18 acetylase RimI-like enzyme
MKSTSITYTIGILQNYRTQTITLFDEAFGQKLSIAIPSQSKRRKLLHHYALLQYAIGAFDGDVLLGIAGFHSPNGSFLTDSNITLRGLIEHLGFWGGLKAGIVLSLFERKPKDGELLLDAICVDAKARGQGIGSGLLNQIQHYAKYQGYKHIRLDVIDTNPKAKVLYQKMGFELERRESFAYLKNYFGFSGVDTMVYPIK